MKIKSKYIIAVFFLLSVTLTGAENLKDSVEKFDAIKVSFEELLQDAKLSQDSFDKKYAVELEKLEEASKQKGNLELVLAIRHEQDGFRAVSESVLSTHAELAKLQRIYAERSAEIQKVENKAVKQLLEVYLEKLESLVNELTKAGEIDLAVSVQKERKRAEGLMSSIPAEIDSILPQRDEPEPVEGISVLQALYGSAEQFEKGAAHDVTEKVKKYIVDGKLYIENSKDAFGDPHPFRGKRFKMTYLRDGKTKRKGKPYEFESGVGEIEVSR